MRPKDLLVWSVGIVMALILHRLCVRFPMVRISQVDAETRRPFGDLHVLSTARGSKTAAWKCFTISRKRQTCVHALFPHAGYLPCWYLRKSDIKEVYLMDLTDGLDDWLNDGRGDSGKAGLRSPVGLRRQGGSSLYAFSAPSRA